MITPLRATALLAVLATLATSAAARADGDPASDVLLIQDVYLPYAPQPAKPLSRTLTTLVGRVKQAGYPMKVALIETRGDLGAYPNLYGQAQRYAKLLAREIVFRVRHPHLLVVMPSGFGTVGLGGRSAAVLAKISVDRSAQSDGLVRAAVSAVAALATANGHPTKVPTVPATAHRASSGGSDSHTLLYVIAGVIVALGIAFVAVSVRLRRAA